MGSSRRCVLGFPWRVHHQGEIDTLHREDLKLNRKDHDIRANRHRPDTDRVAAVRQAVANGIRWGWFDMVVDVPPGFDLARAMAKYEIRNGQRMIFF